MPARDEETIRHCHVRRCRRGAVILLLAAVACLLTAELFRSATGAYAFRSVAESREPFERFFPSPAINAAGTVVFHARLLGGEEGIFAVGSSHPLPVTLASTRADFGSFDPVPSINDAGVVVFSAGYKTGGPTDACAVDARGGPLTRVAHTSGSHTHTPGGIACINRDGHVAFFASADDGSSGIYVGTSRGGPVTSVVDNKGGFYTFGLGPVIDDAAHVVFVANGRNGSWGIYSVEKPGDPPRLLLADHTRNFLHVDGPVIGSPDRVVFHGVQSDGSEGIYAMSRMGGPIAAVVAPRQGGYRSFFGLAANVAGSVAFSAMRGTGSWGIYTGSDPVHARVAGPGDPLFGSIVNRAILAGGGLNRRGEIAFFYALADERTGIAVATPSRWGAWTVTVAIVLTLMLAGAIFLFALSHFMKPR